MRRLSSAVQAVIRAPYTSATVTVGCGSFEVSCLCREDVGLAVFGVVDAFVRTAGMSSVTDAVSHLRVACGSRGFPFLPDAVARALFFRFRAGLLMTSSGVRGRSPEGTYADMIISWCSERVGYRGPLSAWSPRRAIAVQWPGYPFCAAAAAGVEIPTAPGTWRGRPAGPGLDQCGVQGQAGQVGAAAAAGLVPAPVQVRADGAGAG